MHCPCMLVAELMEAADHLRPGLDCKLVQVVPLS